MRRKVAEQLGLVTTTADHVRARELAMVSRVLDGDLLDKNGEPKTGREAMTAEQVLRAMVLKQRFALSYEGLAFVLSDSNSVRAFCRLPLSMSTPARSTLQSNIKRVKASTWEQINRFLITFAQDKKRLRIFICTIHRTRRRRLHLSCRPPWSEEWGPLQTSTIRRSVSASKPSPTSIAASPRRTTYRRVTGAGAPAGTSSTSCGALLGLAAVVRRDKFRCQACSDRPSIRCCCAHPRSVFPERATADRHARASFSSTIFRNVDIADLLARRLGADDPGVIPVSPMGHDIPIHG
jgi:hypothetical protein